MQPILNLFSRLGPLAPAIFFFVAAASWFAFNRLVLAGIFHTNIGDVEGVYRLFPVGLRMDSVLLSVTLLIPGVLLLLLPKGGGRWLRPIFATYFALLASVFILMDVATTPFLNEYGSRPNQLFFQNFTHPREILTMAWSEYGALIVLATVFIAVGAWWTWRCTSHLMRNHRHWHYKWRVLALPFLIALLAVGARSGTGNATANPGMSTFSASHTANQIALNSTYSLLFSIYRYVNNPLAPEQLYGELPAEEVAQRVRRVAQIDGVGDAGPGTTNATLHTQTTNVPSQRPRNLVIILMESLGSEFVGSLGGLPLTPNIDRLAEEGLFFTNLYAIGTRTSRGVEALVSSLPPTTQHGSMLKLDLSQHNFFTVAELLKRKGYDTSFIYGGEAHFDNMAGFLGGNGVNRIIGDSDFDRQLYHNDWGVADEDMFARAHAMFEGYGEKPFFSLILTLSNHSPFEFPAGRIELYDQPANTRNNAAKYADYAIGRFFEQAKKSPYYQNTVFVLVADHPMRVVGESNVPVRDYHIPALILGGGVAPARHEKLASQIDLMPTAVGLLGLDLQHPAIGRDLMKLPAGTPGRAMMIYNDTMAYWQGDDVVIHAPQQAPQQFRLVGKVLQPALLDKELERDALAHILFPAQSYHARSYRLP